MDEEESGPLTRQARLHALLRLAALVAAALAVPRLLDRLGVRDVSWAPPEYPPFAEVADAPPVDPVPRASADAPPADRRLP